MAFLFDTSYFNQLYCHFRSAILTYEMQVANCQKNYPKTDTEYRFLDCLNHFKVFLPYFDGLKVQWNQFVVTFG